MADSTSQIPSGELYEICNCRAPVKFLKSSGKEICSECKTVFKIWDRKSTNGVPVFGRKTEKIVYRERVTRTGHIERVAVRV